MSFSALHPETPAGESEKLASNCLLHTNVFLAAKKFKKLCQRDQKILFQFVDQFLPPNHGFYFLIREILQTTNKNGAMTKVNDGIDDSSDGEGDHHFSVTNHAEAITSIRDYGGLRTLYRRPNEFMQNKKRRHIHENSPSEDETSSSSDGSASTRHIAKRSAKKTKLSKRGTPQHTLINNKKRNVYRLLNSASANSVERHYHRALSNELIYSEQCQTHITHEHHNDNSPLLFIHRSFTHCNNITGNTLITAEQWHLRSDSRIKRHIQYDIQYPASRNECEELQPQPPGKYLIALQLTINRYNNDKLIQSINYLRENAANRADLLSRFIRRYENKINDTVYRANSKKKRPVKAPASSSGSESDHKRRPASQSPDIINERAINTTARRFGILHLLPAEVRNKNRHLYSLDELNYLTDYVINAASTKIIKLIDFALLSASDTWALLNTIMDHALDIYQETARYPVQDSLSSILLYDTEKTEKWGDADSDHIFNIGRYALLWQQGESAKLGDIITFVQSYRRLVCTVLSTCCCYFMNRCAENTRSFIEKHRCLLPKATQGIYFSLFLRIRAVDMSCYACHKSAAPMKLIYG